MLIERSISTAACTRRPLVRPFFAITLAATALLAACGQQVAKAPSQVALTVNGKEVSVHQVELALQRLGPASIERTEAATRRVLDGMVEQELAAQAAAQDGLDRDPRVLQAMEAARREVLARAYQDKLAERADEPSTDEIDRYYEAHPQLFAQRRLYQLQESWLALPAERVAALKPRLQATATPAQLAEVLRAESVNANLRQVSVSAEDLPMPVLERLAALKEGQSIVLPLAEGARVITLVSSQLAPVQRHAARRSIAAYLHNERRTRLMQQGIAAMREKAKVEYQGRFASISRDAAASTSAAASMPIAR